jgi:hypothetical protein
MCLVPQACPAACFLCNVLALYCILLIILCITNAVTQRTADGCDYEANHVSGHSATRAVMRLGTLRLPATCFLYALQRLVPSVTLCIQCWPQYGQLLVNLRGSGCPAIYYVHNDVFNAWAALAALFSGLVLTLCPFSHACRFGTANDDVRQRTYWNLQGCQKP